MPTTAQRLKSRPVRARGLKLGSPQYVLRIRVSRPVRARGLKQRPGLVHDFIDRSRPVRARGLKLVGVVAVAYWTLSRPVRARGLKRNHRNHITVIGQVAPRAGAWIETRFALHQCSYWW